MDFVRVALKMEEYTFVMSQMIEKRNRKIGGKFFARKAKFFSQHINFWHRFNEN